MPAPKILIAIPSFGNIYFETTVSLLNLRDNCPFNTAIKLKKATYVHTARNRLVYDAVAAEATHLMFIDADMQFKPNAFNEMMEKSIKRNLDLVGGLYVSRFNEKTNIIKKIIKPKDGEPFLQDIKELPTTKDLFEVDVIGTGFLLIKMDVFKKLNPPFFYYTSPKEFGMKEVPFPNSELGEDVVFCLNAKKSGFQIFCDPTIELGHVGDRTYRHPQFGETEKIPGEIE